MRTAEKDIDNWTKQNQAAQTTDVTSKDSKFCKTCAKETFYKKKTALKKIQKRRMKLYQT